MSSFFAWRWSSHRRWQRHQVRTHRRVILGAERLERRQLLAASAGSLPLPQGSDFAGLPFPHATLNACEEAISPVVFSAMKAAPSGDYRVEALRYGSKWGTSDLTFSFYAGGTYYGNESSPTPVSDAVKANVRHILKDIIAPLINVTFTEVSDTPTNYGLLRYLCSTTSNYDYAKGYYPNGNDTNNGTSSDVGGDVVLKPSYDVGGNDFNSRFNSFQSSTGSHGFSTLIHETGHALGLKHPHEVSPTLPLAEDNQDNTVMTYTRAGSKAATPMVYDVLALQYLYGANTSTRVSDTTYTFTAADVFSPGSGATGAPTLPFGDSKNMLWDAGGIDTVDLSALTGGYRIDIQPGGWITRTTAYNGVIYDSSYKTTDYGTRIPLEGTTIENVVASRSADAIYLNSAANVVSGYAPATSSGVDAIYNSDQSDTLDLGLFKQASVAQSQSGNDLVLNLGSARTVTVKNYYADPVGSRMLIIYQPGVSATITADRSALKAGEVAMITFTLSTIATNFTAGDITVFGGSISGFLGSGVSYTAVFTPTPNFTGTATLAVAAGAFTAGAGNANDAASPLAIAVDTVAPTLMITRGGTGTLMIGTTDTITFTLSEPSTAFSAGDISVSGGSVSSFLGSGVSYTAVFTPTPNFTGSATLAVAAGTFTDGAGNANLAASPLSIHIGLDAAPTAPINVTGVAGNGQVSLSWNAPSDNGGRSITDYVIQYSSNGGATWSMSSDAVSPATTATVTGLTNGGSYVFRVAAVNGVGPGPYSATSVAVVPGGPAAAPINVAGVAGNGQVSLRWYAPPDNGGRSITDYVIQYSSNGGATWSMCSDAVSPATRATVAGLTNGVSYVFRVAAVTSVGQGAWTAASAPVTRFALATIPQNVQVNVQGGQAVVTWAEPSSNGGAAIVDYRVQSSTNGGRTWTTFTDGVSSTTGATVTGLNNGTSYVFRVAALTTFATGTFSAPTAAAISIAVPGAVTGLSATAGTSFVTLVWTAPATNGGSPVTDYALEYRASGSSQWILWNHAPSAATQAVITGLVSGTGYNFRVTAVTGFGQGAGTETLTAVVPMLPPTRLTGRALNGSVSLGWVAPRLPARTRILDYQIQYSTDFGATWTTVSRSPSTAARGSVAGLTNGTFYIFRVAAVTTAGVGSFSANSARLRPIRR